MDEAVFRAYIAEFNAAIGPDGRFAAIRTGRYGD
jgi:hypothetical protein